MGTQTPSAFIPFQPSTFLQQQSYNPQIYSPQVYDPQFYDPQVHDPQFYDPQSFQNYQQPSYAPPSSCTQYPQQYASDYQQQTCPVVQPKALDLSSSTSQGTHSSVQTYSSTASANNFYGNQIAQQC